jgi:ABC-type transport system involved in multi-copper enzyme maturation permease subunit
MKWRRIIAIVQKDLIEVRENKSIWAPMIIVPAVFIIGFPLAFLLGPPRVDGMLSSMNSSTSGLNLFIEHMPVSMSSMLVGLTPFQSLITLILGFIFAPMFLIFPLLFSTIIASESFAGEYERKTVEALLYTPATDQELFMGKVATALIPSLSISWLSFLAYTLVLDIAGYPIFGRIWFPFPSWYALIFWITPALAVLGISTTVLISARTRTFMGTYQASASLVVLVLGLVVGQISGVLYLDVPSGLLVGLVAWIAAGVVTLIAVKSFNRARLLTGLKL